jgi:hypothetical protein
MAQTKLVAVLLLGSGSLAFAGCASAPAAPFDQLETANVVAYRLQNFEPPPQAAPAAAAPGTPAIPGVALPPEIQNWIQQGAAALPQLIPPGLIPPGLIPGVGAAPAAAPAPVAENVPRFRGFRILNQTQVVDPKLKEELAEIFGDPDNFSHKHANCAYAEMGLAFGQGQPGQPGVMSNELTISFSCNQVIAGNFAWPHQASGMNPEMVSALSEVVSKLWPPGT